jgi:hypothetical protein
VKERFSGGNSILGPGWRYEKRKAKRKRKLMRKRGKTGKTGKRKNERRLFK